jgi:hypothetical protein
MKNTFENVIGKCCVTLVLLSIVMLGASVTFKKASAHVISTNTHCAIKQHDKVNALNYSLHIEQLDTSQ